MSIYASAAASKTKPIQSQSNPILKQMRRKQTQSKPKQTQNKPNQTQFQPPCAENKPNQTQFQTSPACRVEASGEDGALQFHNFDLLSYPRHYCWF
jgi:hypothetical protein